MSKTPLLSAVEGYILQKNLRLHTPGHAGVGLLNFKAFSEVLPYDITELDGLESLFESCGAIFESEVFAAKALQAKNVIYSASGSTPLIQSALSVARSLGRKIIFIGPVHKSAVNACILLDIMPIFTNFNEVGSFLKQDDIGAVFVVNPTYYGEIFNVSELSKTCKELNIPLILDSAHGAHLQFISSVKQAFCRENPPAVVINSPHKTLPVLTGGAWAQVFDDRFSAKTFKEHMSLFASTSPSYLVLLSLELCLSWLLSGGVDKLNTSASLSKKLADFLINMGFSLISNDPLRLTVSAQKFGCSGVELQKYLKKHGIAAEMADFNYLVLLLHPSLNAQDFEQIGIAFKEIFEKIQPDKNVKKLEKSAKISEIFEDFAPKMEISPREAHLSNKETVLAENALNRIAAKLYGPTPPGVPLTVPGSKICKKTQKLLKNYGIFEVLVVK